MAGRTPYDAVEAFRSPIAEALGCFGHVSLSPAPGDTPGDRKTNRYVEGSVRTFGINAGRGMVLKSQGKPITLLLAIQVEIVAGREDVAGEWFKVSTRKWIHVLRRDDREMVAYHWHPDEPGDKTYPHLHLDGKSSPHYPTGRVLIEDLLMLAVEMGAEPVDRARWDECHERNRSNFALGATWGLPVKRI